MWIPGLGSPSTIDFCAERGFGYMGVAYYAPPETFTRQAARYWETVERTGRPVVPENLGWLTTVYVGDTDEEARAEALPHLAYFAGNLAAGFVGAGKVWMPPGYLDAAPLVQFLADLRQTADRRRDGPQALFDAYPMVGSVETVRERLLEFVLRHRVGTVLALLSFGSLPADLAGRSLERYATEVVPWVRERAAVALAGAGPTP